MPQTCIEKRQISGTKKATSGTNISGYLEKSLQSKIFTRLFDTQKSAFFILKFMAFKNHIFTKICSKTSKKVFYKTKDTKKFLCAHAIKKSQML